MRFNPELARRVGGVGGIRCRRGSRSVKSEFGRTSREPAQRELSGEDILGTTRQAAAADFLLARLAAAFLGAALRLSVLKPADQAASPEARRRHTLWQDRSPLSPVLTRVHMSAIVANR